MPRAIPQPTVTLGGLSWPNGHFDKCEKLSDEKLEKLCELADVPTKKSDELKRIIVASLSEVVEQKSRNSKPTKKKAHDILRHAANMRSKMLPAIEQFYADEVTHPLGLHNFHQILEHLKETKGISPSREARLEILAKVSPKLAAKELEEKILKHPFEGLVNDLEVIEEQFSLYLEVMGMRELKVDQAERNTKKVENQQMVWAAANSFYWLTGCIPDVKYCRYPHNRNHKKLVGEGAEFIKGLLHEVFSIDRKLITISEDLKQQPNKAWI